VREKVFGGTLLSMHDLDPDSPNRRAGRHHRRTALGVLSVAALLLHAAAFSGLDWVWPQTEAPVLPAAMHAVAAVELAPAIVERPMAGAPVSVEPVERQAPVRREAPVPGRRRRVPKPARRPRQRRSRCLLRRRCSSR
jgi:hypothetical protein